MATQQLPPDARFSTYSGAPSIQPSLAPTFSTASHRTSSNSAHTSRSRYSSRSAYTMSAPVSKHASAPSSSSSTSYTNEKAPYHNPKTPYAYSGTTATESTSTLGASNDPKAQDIKTWHQGFERMQDERLDKQRYVMSGNKSEEVSKIALGAKVERALGRRMVGQDASFSTRKVPGTGSGSGSGEKAVEVEVK